MGVGKIATTRRAVSTHSRAEAAADGSEGLVNSHIVSTHSRAEAAAIAPPHKIYRYPVSTHSRAEAAAVKVSPVVGEN